MEEKTKNIINRNTTNIEEGLKIDGQAFKKVKKFRFLGILISSKNVIDDEMKSRIAAYNTHFCSLEQIFRSISMSKAADHYTHNYHHHRR